MFKQEKAPKNEIRILACKKSNAIPWDALSYSAT